jgi:hypothetical protein
MRYAIMQKSFRIVPEMLAAQGVKEFWGLFLTDHNSAMFLCGGLGACAETPGVDPPPAGPAPAERMFGDYRLADHTSL